MGETISNIAVIGGGAAGLTAAYLLQQHYVVTLYEKNNYAGGYANTVVIPNGPDKGKPVDTGFTLLNDQTYPTFRRLLNRLGVAIRPSEFSFGYWDEKSGLQYAATGPNGFFAQRSNLWNSAFWKILREWVWFKRRAWRDMTTGKLDPLTLGEYIEQGKFSEGFSRDCLLPLGSAIWCTSVREMEQFPAAMFARVLEGLGFLGQSRRLQWQTVEGGSHNYVKAIVRTFKTRVRLGDPVEEVKRKKEQVLVRTRAGQEQAYDKVVLACHADEALGLLADPSEEEQKLLSVWNYQKNNAVLHTDRDVMPPLKNAWACWNYVRERDATLSQPVSMTYHINRLQGLESQEPYFVTLNRVRPIPERYILREMYYTNPTFTMTAVESQKELPRLNGANNTYYCGSYFGDGFHEDAVKSALAVAQCFGIDL